MLHHCTTGFHELKVRAAIGVYPEELAGVQDLRISLEMAYPLSRMPLLVQEDSLSHALDYQSAADLVSDMVRENRYGTLEFMASALATALMEYFPDCPWLDLKIHKPGAVPGSAGGFCNWRAERGS